MTRFTNTRPSAWVIVDLILQKKPVDTLLVQQELVELENILPRVADASLSSVPSPMGSRDFSQFRNYRGAVFNRIKRVRIIFQSIS